MSTDYDDVVDHNNTWAYVPSLPLCMNIMLIDPSTAEHSIDSSIIACICKVKIDSNSSYLFPNCAACEHKSDKETNRTIQWIMDSGASIAFTSMTSDFCDLIYYKLNRQYFSVPHVFQSEPVGSNRFHSDSDLDTNFRADSEWN